VLIAQQTLFDRTRAPEGVEAVWGYCHVPNGSTLDMTDRIEAQVERFAPGFRDRIVDRHVMTPPAMHAYNENYIGGDINGGAGRRRAVRGPPDVGSASLANPGRRRLDLLGLDAAGRRRPRDGRPPCGQRSARTSGPDTVEHGARSHRALTSFQPGLHRRRSRSSCRRGTSETPSIEGKHCHDQRGHTQPRPNPATPSGKRRGIASASPADCSPARPPVSCSVFPASAAPHRRRCTFRRQRSCTADRRDRHDDRGRPRRAGRPPP
jgi:hypothetical protein